MRYTVWYTEAAIYSVKYTTTFYITYALSHIILRIIIFYLRNIIISRQRSYLGPYEIYELLLLRSWIWVLPYFITVIQSRDKEYIGNYLVALK